MALMDDDLHDAPIRIIEHTADWSLRVRGGDLSELFRHAAQGMAFLLAGDVSAIPLEHARDVALQAFDAEELLVVWLGEMAYWAERDGLVFPVAEMRSVTPTALSATVRGGRPPELQKHIKAVTYHDLAIRPTESGLEVTVVFDV